MEGEPWAPGSATGEPLGPREVDPESNRAETSGRSTVRSFWKRVWKENRSGPRTGALVQQFLGLVEAVEFDHLLRDLDRHVGNDVRVEPGVVLFLRLPQFRDAEALVVHEGGMEDEAGLLLDVLDERWRHLVVQLGRHAGWSVADQDGHVLRSRSGCRLSHAQGRSAGERDG